MKKELFSGGKRRAESCFVDEPTDDLEQGEDFAKNCMENFERERRLHATQIALTGKVISSHSRSKNKNSNRMLSLATQKEPGDGKEDGLEI